MANTELMSIRRQHNLTSQQLASEAGLPLRTEYQAEIGVAISEQEAHKIIHALSCLIGQNCTIFTLGLLIKPADPDQTLPLPILPHPGKKGASHEKR
jgi:hypothetical protein